MASEAEPTNTETRSRRRFLMVGGAAAVAGTAVLVEGAGKAEAADGTALTVAGTAVPSGPDSAPTRIYNPSATTLSSVLLRIDNYSSAGVSLPASSRIGIVGTASGTDTQSYQRIGVYGATDLPAGGNGYGVYGVGTTGVYGSGNNGVWGNSASSSGNGIYGYASGSDGWGIDAFSVQSYGGGFSGGRANVRLIPGGTPPLSRSDAHSSGELVVDNTGVLWYCTGSGTPGTWVSLSSPTFIVPSHAGTGAPTDGTWAKGALVLDDAGSLFVCTAAGSPGSWVRIEPASNGATGAQGAPGPQGATGAAGQAGSAGVASPAAVGKGKVARGRTSVVIKDPRVKSTSHVAIALTSNPGKAALSFVSPKAGSGFTVHLTHAAPAAGLSFSYNIVG